LWVLAILSGISAAVLIPLAETRVTSVLAGISAGLIPLVTLLLLVTAFRSEKVHAHQVVGLLIGFGGLFIVTAAWQGLGKNPLWAMLALLGVVVGYGLAFPYIKRFIVPYGLNPLSLAASQQLLSSFTLLPFFLIDGTKAHVFSFSVVTPAVALGVFAGGFAYVWNFRTIELVGSSIASTVEYVAAILAVIAGVFVLHEPMFWYEPVGGAIIIFGALIGWGQLRIPTRRSS
jgi:drug/metabolite transporter (DMT)-like permease